MTIRAADYQRVSDPSQVEGHSLDAQQRLFYELCKARGWEPVGVYREEGRSAHSEAIAKRPVFKQLLEDAGKGLFDVVVVHSIDRWSRNLRVTLESFAILAKHNVSIVSITENIDYSTPQGKLFIQMLGAFAEYFSGALAAHVSKGLDQRAFEGKHTGGIPFGFESCWIEENGERKRRCNPEHPGSVHIIEKEGTIVTELFQRYAAGTTTLSQLAIMVNELGFRTHNMHNLPDAKGIISNGPRLFTTASIRGILHNSFYAGQVAYRGKLLPGKHEALISKEVFDIVQSTLKKNSGRSETLTVKPQRQYLLKGIIRCAYCGMPMSSQTYYSGNAYYREQNASRSSGLCNEGAAIACHIIDEQIEALVSAIELGPRWLEEVLAIISLKDEVHRVKDQRLAVLEKQRRMGKAYVDGLFPDGEYQRQKKLLEMELESLVVPAANAAEEAGTLIINLKSLWAEANLEEKRKLLFTMLDAVYVDARKTKSIVAIRPKPPFKPIFQVAVAKEGSQIRIINEPIRGTSVFLVETGERACLIIQNQSGRIGVNPTEVIPMPLRPLNREQVWLLPPTLGELIPKDHPARFVAEFVDALDRTAWVELGIGPDGEPLGAPAYHPRALLCVWLHGFMTGIRSSRKLEAACRDQVPYLWLTGWQHPDHNTLWRFYQAHRDAMRRLLKYTVATAIELDLIDLAVQAVDGTKIAANAAGDRTYDAAELQHLLNRTEAAVSELEAQNEGGDDSSVPRLPEELQSVKKLQQRIKDAMNHLTQQEKMKRVNLTDEDAQLMKGRSGIITGYNAQAMVSPLNPKTAKRNGMLITAAEVVNSASDSSQLVPMMEQAEDLTGKRTPVTLADGGYHTAANLEAGARREQTLVMTERYRSESQGSYFKDKFIFNSETDSYTCPQGQRLPFRGMRRSKLTGLRSIRVYRASRTACRTCPAFGICTRDKHAGRALWISSADDLLHKHRQWMNTDEARTLYARRKQMIEPIFGILKDQMNVRRFLLRGLANVSAEFNLLATAFNLRTLWRVFAKLGRRNSKVRIEIPDKLGTNIQIHRFFDSNLGTPSVLNFAQ